MLFICYTKCSTCQKARAFLDARGVKYDLRDIKTENPTEAELRVWYEKAACRSSDFLIPAAYNTGRWSFRKNYLL